MAGTFKMTPMTQAGFESKPSAEIKRRLSNPNIDPLIQMSPVTVRFIRFFAVYTTLIRFAPKAHVCWICVQR